MDAPVNKNASGDISVSASGHRRALDPNPFGRPSEAGVPCDEGAGPGARAAGGRRPRRPLGRGVRLVREVRVVRVERRRVLRRIAQELRNRRSDELELLASPLHSPSDEEGGASPTHAPSMGEDAVGDAVPEAIEEALPRRRRYPSEMDDVNPEWLHWQYPELPPTPPTKRSPCAYRQRTKRSGGHRRLRRSRTTRRRCRGHKRRRSRR
ncbi:GH25252 [Drosophila grimshawi]|uniref:GH25252 n=1 Tax=Drosophila grimshawi TaxID=7222 RepID=B4K2H9_DROGR|nr:GH25252 [Drosophila grimshawi]